MRHVLLCLIMLASCGREKVRERLVREEPKMIEVGAKGHYSLSAAESSGVIKAGYMDVEVAGISDSWTSLRGVAVVDTIIGKKTYVVAGDIENGLLTPEFLRKLRSAPSYQAANTLITHEGLTDELCDRLVLSEIRNYPDLILAPQLCIQSRTVPVVKVLVRSGRDTYTAFFRADD